MSKYLVTRRSLRHRSGSKEYHLLLITNAETKHSLIALRWGKTGAWGQMQVISGSSYDMIKVLNSKTHEKEKGGYNQIVNNVSNAETVDEVKKLATVAYWAKLGGDNIRKVMPEADITGIQEQTPAEFTENGDGTYSKKHTVKEHPAFVETEETRAQREQEKAKEKQKADPLWGMF